MAYDPNATETLWTISASAIPGDPGRFRERVQARPYCRVLRADEVFVWSCGTGSRDVLTGNVWFSVMLDVPRYVGSDAREELDARLNGLVAAYLDMAAID